MATKESNMSVRSDADLQAIQTSVAFKNISDAVEQYRRQFGLAFLALVAFSAVHVGLVVIANLYTMQTRVNHGLLTDASDSTRAVGTAVSVQTYDLGFIMSSMGGEAQVQALSSLESASFVDKLDNYRQYTVTGFQLGGYKRSELKLYTSVGHILEYVRGKGLRVYTEVNTQRSCNCTGSRRSLLDADKLLWQLKNGRREAELNDALLAYAHDERTADLSKLSEFNNVGEEILSDVATDYVHTPDTLRLVNILTGHVRTDCNVEDAVCIRNAVLGGSNGGDLFDTLEPLFNVRGNDGAKGKLTQEQRDRLKRVDTNMDTAIARGKYLVGNAMAGMKGPEFDAAKALIDTAVRHGESFYGTLGTNPWSLEVDENGDERGFYDVETIERDVKLSIRDATEYSLVGSKSYFDHVRGEDWSNRIDIDAGGASHNAGSFACTGESADTYTLSDTDLVDEARTVCAGVEDSTGQVLGGYFFSPVLGTYEAFLAIVPLSYCTVVKDMIRLGADKPVDFYGFFLFYLHGWGESAGVIVELKGFLSNLIYHSDLVLIAPDDNGTPFGGRTWYRNSDFTGYHTDMIVFELPTFVTGSTGLTSYGNALFGCSMGGAGSLSILMTYPTEFVGAAPFNAPTEANSCIRYGTCHLECLVDAFMCELVWTSPGVAYNPFVLITSGSLLSSVGYYQPVALGIAEKVKEDGMAGCMKESSAYTCNHFACVMATNSGRLHNSFHSEGKLDKDQKAFSSSLSSFVYASDADIGKPAGDMFWLDPIWFVVVTQGFMPTHNIYTDEERNDNCATMYGLLNTMPTWRLDNTPGILSTGSDGGLYIFMSTDTNDDEDHGFGILEMAHRFVGLLIADSSSQGSFYEDRYGSGGHTMSVRDFKTAIQFFSDVSRNGKNDGTTDKDGVTTYGVRAANAGIIPAIAGRIFNDGCPGYLLISEVNVVQQSAHAILNYMAKSDTHVNECSSGRPTFDWGNWDCGGCDTENPGSQKFSYGDNPVDVDKFKGKQTDEGACYRSKIRMLQL